MEDEGCEEHDRSSPEHAKGQRGAVPGFLQPHLGPRHPNATDDFVTSPPATDLQTVARASNCNSLDIKARRYC